MWDLILLRTHFSCMLIYNVDRGTILMNYIDTRFVRNAFMVSKQLTARVLSGLKLVVVVLHPIKLSLRPQAIALTVVK